MSSITHQMLINFCNCSPLNVKSEQFLDENNSPLTPNTPAHNQALENSAQELFDKINREHFYPTFNTLYIADDSIDFTHKYTLSNRDNLWISFNVFLCNIMKAFNINIYNRVRAIVTTILNASEINKSPTNSSSDGEVTSANNVNVKYEDSEKDALSQIDTAPRPNIENYELITNWLAMIMSTPNINQEQLLGFIALEEYKKKIVTLNELLNTEENISDFEKVQLEYDNGTQLHKIPEYTNLTTRITHELFPDIFNKDGSVIPVQAEEAALT